MNQLFISKLETAHCIYNLTSLTLVFGSLNLYDPYKVVTVSEKDIVIHPDYKDERSTPNDIGNFSMTSYYECTYFITTLFHCHSRNYAGVAVKVRSKNR